MLRHTGDFCALRQKVGARRGEGGRPSRGTAVTIEAGNRGGSPAGSGCTGAGEAAHPLVGADSAPDGSGQGGAMDGVGRMAGQ